MFVQNRLLFMVSFSMLLLFSACGPINKYWGIQGELEESRDRLKASEAKLKIADLQIKNLAAELGNAEKVGNKCLEDLTNLQAQNAYLKNINLQLSERLEGLKTNLDKKESVIQLQEKVIRLLDDTKKTIETSLKDQIASQEVEIVAMGNKLKVIFVDRILFNSGKVNINERGKNLLLVIADSIRDHDNQSVVIEGHTDNVPVSEGLRKRFPSNWELSTARAAAVVRYLQEYGRIPPQRLSVRGYGFYRPVALNNTEEGRRQNRRIEIILGPGD